MTRAALAVIHLINDLFLDCMSRKRSWGDISTIKVRGYKN